METDSLTTRMQIRLLLDGCAKDPLCLLLDARRRGRGQARMDLVSTNTHLYQQGHVTAKGTAKLWLWALLWAPLRGLPPRLQRRQGYVEMSLVVAVQVPGDIARCMLIIIHCNAGISMSGVGELFLRRRWLCYRRWLCRRRGRLCRRCVWLCRRRR
jgi:hypothetical protein